MLGTPFEEFPTPRGPKPTAIPLTDGERAKLTGWARRPTSAQRLALRARVVVAAALGHANAAIAADPRVAVPTARRWRDRSSERRLEGLAGDPRPGTPRTITDEPAEAAVTRAPEPKPASATHGSTRALARDLGLSQTAVARIWRALGLKPHRRDSLKLSTDPPFAEEARGVVGLDLVPPERAVVLCVGGEAQVQALDRTQPIRPLLPGRSEKAGRDYVRHGAAARLAAPDAAAGEGIGTRRQQHRHQELLAFLGHLAAALTRPPEVAIHVVMGNYGAHERPRARDRFARHPEFAPHFAPTRSSWLNRVERFFAAITERRSRRGAFRSVPELEQAIGGYLRSHSERPRPLVGTKSADPILSEGQNLAARLAPDKPATNF